MKTSKIRLSGILLFLACAATPMWGAVEPVTFERHELSIDGFGYYASLDKGGGDNEAWGYGIGINYFVTENVGIGADTYADAFESPYLLNISGIFRYPLLDLCPNLAPYGFASIGRQWEHNPAWLFRLGGGAEFRIQQNLGVFADLSGVFPVDRDPYAWLRFGFRIQLALR